MAHLIPYPNNELGPEILPDSSSYWLPYAISASYAITSSYAEVANYAITASYASHIIPYVGP
jgi:hypothetical protein